MTMTFQDNRVRAQIMTIRIQCADTTVAKETWHKILEVVPFLDRDAPANIVEVTRTEELVSK